MRHTGHFFCDAIAFLMQVLQKIWPQVVECGPFKACKQTGHFIVFSAGTGCCWLSYVPTYTTSSSLSECAFIYKNNKNYRLHTKNVYSLDLPSSLTTLVSSSLLEVDFLRSMFPMLWKCKLFFKTIFLRKASLLSFFKFSYKSS